MGAHRPPALGRHVVKFVPDKCIPRHRGRCVPQGAFLVVKPGRTLDGGRPVGRLIMDVRQTNALMRVLEGDLDSMALPSQFLSVVLDDDEILLIGGEDMVSCV